MRINEADDMVIKFYDNEQYDYPLVVIPTGDFKKFKSLLKKEQKSDTYNFDDFLHTLKEKGIDVEMIGFDVEIFFWGD